MEIRNLTYSLSLEDNSRQGVTAFGRNVDGAVKQAEQDVEALRTKMRNTTSSLAKDFQRIERTSTPPLEKVRASFEKKRKTVERYRREMAGVPKEVERATRVLRNLDDQLNRTERKIKSSTNSLRAMALAFQKVRSLAAVGFAGYAASRVGAGAVGTAAGFEQQMSAVQAVTRISSKTSEVFGQLNDQARELGANTVFSARQAGEGMEYLARAGFNANQVLSAMPGTLALAAAGQLDLGRAADISSNVLTGFNLAAEEADRVADVLADSAASANTNVTQLGDAMKFVSPVSAGLGVSLEETTAAISALSDAGLQGEMAGTGLRRVLIGLADPSDDLKAKLNGISIESDGLVAVLDQLAVSGLSVTDAIGEFEQRGGPAASILVEFRDKVRDLNDQFEDAEGSAQSISSVMINNLAGSATQASAAIRDLAIEMGEGGLLAGSRNLVDTFTEAMRSDGALELARNLGSGLGTALNGIADNWELIGTLTQTATNFALVYGGIKFAAFLGGLKAVQAAWVGLTAAAVTSRNALIGWNALLLTTSRSAAAAAVGMTTLSAVMRGVVAGLSALRVAAMSFIATPLGLALTAAGAAFLVLQNRSANATKQVEDDARRMRDAAARVGLSSALEDENTTIEQALDRRQQIIDDLGDGPAAALEAEADRLRRKLNRLGLGSAIDEEAADAKQALDRRNEIVTSSIRDMAQELGLAQSEVKEAFETFDLAAALQKQVEQVEPWKELYNKVVDGFIQDARAQHEELKDLMADVEASTRVFGPRGDMAAIGSTNRFRRAVEPIDAEARRLAEDRTRIAVTFPEGSQGYELALNTDKSVEEIRAILEEAEALKVLFRDLEISLDNMDASKARKALEEATALARQLEQLEKLEASRGQQAALLDKLRISKEAYELEQQTQQILRQNDAITREQAETEARKLLSIRAQTDALNEQYQVNARIQDLKDNLNRDEKELRVLWEALAISKEEYQITKEMLRLRAEYGLQLDDETRALAERNLRLQEGLETAESIAEAYDQVPGGSPGRRGRLELQQDAFGNLRERTREFGDQLKDVWADVFTSFVDEGIDAFDIITDYFRDRARQNFRDVLDTLLTPDANSPFGAATPGINGPSPVSAISLRDLFFGQDNRGPIVGQDGTQVTGDPFATPAPRRGLSTQQVAQGAAVGLNIYQGYQQNGTAGALNSAAQTLAASSPQGALAILGGQIGLAVANEIDGNGANETTAAFGQFFGAIGGLIAGLTSKRSNFTGVSITDLRQGRVINADQRDNSEESTANRQLSERIGTTVAQTLGSVLNITGGSLRDNRNTSYREDLLNVDVGSRDGIQIGFQGQDGRPKAGRTFESSEAGARDAIEYAFQLAFDQVEGGTQSLVEFAKAALDAGQGVEGMVEGLQNIQTALDYNKEPVSDLVTRLNDINEAFDLADAASKSAGGIDSLNLDAERNQALGRVATDFDDQIRADRLAIDSSIQGQAEALFDSQIDRLSDAKALSDEVGGSFKRALEVIALNRSELTQFIEQAATSPEAFLDLTEALSAVSDQAAKAGVDLATVSAALKLAGEDAAAAFDERVRTDRLAVDSPLQAQAEALLEGQIARLRDANALSAQVGGGDQRTADVIGLNTAELAEFINQAAEGPDTFLQLSDALNAVSERAAEAGVDLGAVSTALEAARKEAASSFDDAQESRLVQSTNDVAFRYNEIIKAQKDLVEQARSLGANVDLVQRANAAERQAFLDGLSDEDRIELGDALGLLEDNLGRTAYLLSSLNQAFSDQVLSADETAAEAQQLADQWRSIHDSLDQGIEQIFDRYRPGTLAEQSEQLRGEFFAADARARDGSLSIEDRQQAAAEALRAGESLLGVERQLGFTSTYFDTIFNQVTERLGSLQDLVNEEGNSQQTRADSAEATATALNDLYQALNQPSVEVPELINIQTQLAEANQHLSGQADAVLSLLDEYIRSRQSSDGLAAQADQILSVLDGQITADQLGVGATTLATAANDNGGANVVGFAGANQTAVVAATIGQVLSLKQTLAGQGRTANETASQALSVDRDILEVLSAMRSEESQRQIDVIQSFVDAAPQFQQAGQPAGQPSFDDQRANQQLVQAVEQMRDALATAVNEASASNAAANEDVIKGLNNRVSTLERAVDEAHDTLKRIETLLKNGSALTTGAATGTGG